MIFADLISVVPGLMVWTLIAFGITFFVLRKFAFGRIQGIIEERRDRIREALDEADKARQEARELRELTKKEREEAKSEREQILDDSRRQLLFSVRKVVIERAGLDVCSLQDLVHTRGRVALPAEQQGRGIYQRGTASIGTGHPLTILERSLKNT